MGVFGSEIHIVTFLIALFELVFFFYQIIYYLSRPQDKSRLFYLILLYLLIQYNLISGLLPDPNIPINLIVQNILAFSVALVMAMYFPYYFYRAYELKRLQFYAHGGSLVFLLVPFIAFFLIPYLITKDLELCRRIVVIVPFLYALSFLYSLRKAIRNKNKEQKEIYEKEIIGMYVGVMFWSLLPIIAFFETDLNEVLKPIMNFHNGSQVVEVLTTNCGLLVMTVLFIRRTVKQSRAEYVQLQELNTELANKVKERTKELELANEQKTNTFINLAHETKTPLTLINNYFHEYISKNGETEELRIIKNNLSKLTRDISNFFDIEKINKGLELYNHNQITDFSKILKGNLELFKLYALKKNIELDSDIQDGVYIKADPQSLFRIMNNLVENAIKYTNLNGAINIVLKSGAGKTIFSIKDNGIGIPHNVQTRVFDPYYQINSEKGNSQGIGLGLSIVKNIVDSLGGKVEIISNPKVEKGTEIILSLNSCAVEDVALIQNTNYLSKDLLINVERLNITDEIIDDERPIILIIEDNIELINYMAYKLKEHFNIYIATSGNEAIEKLKIIQKLDLIISDVMMDNGNGIEFYKAISKQKRYKHLPLIFITAKNTPEDKIEALALGAIDYIQKPFVIEEVINKINSVIKNIQRQRKALLDAAYNSMMTVEKEEDVEEYAINIFESNCLKFKLTDREIEVAKFLANGNTSKETAYKLHIAEATVSKHVQNMYEKLNVNNRVELLKKLGAGQSQHN